MTQEIIFKLLSTRVRPPRCAVFLNKNDKNWQHSLLRIIEQFSNYWGASHNIIIPTDGKSIKNEYWEILKKYKPDYLNVYNKSWKDFRTADENEFERIIKKEVKNYIKGKEQQDEDKLFKMFEETKLSSPYQKEYLKIESSLKNKLIQILNPFSDELERDFFQYNGHQNITLRSILKNYSVSEFTIDDFTFSIDEPYLELLFRSYMGSSKYLRDSINNDWHLMLLDSEKEFTVKYNDLQINENNFADLIFLANTTQKNVCFELINKGLVYYYRNSQKSLKGNVIFVVGDTLEDYCYYYSLKSLIGTVFWFPTALLFNDEENQKYQVTIHWIYDKISRCLSGRYNDNNFFVTSLSLGDNILVDVRNLINKSTIIKYRNFNFVFKKPEELNSLINSTIFVCEEINRSNQFVEQFIDNESVNYIQTPIPKSYSSKSAIDYNWIVDICLRSASYLKDPKGGYNLPPLSEFSKDVFIENVSTLYNNNSTVRFTGECISYLCPNMGLISNSNVDIQTVSPRLKLLDSKEIFERTFETINYKVKISDKGNFARESIILFHTLENLCKHLTDENGVYKILEQYLSQNSSGVRESKGEKGVFLNQRTFLSFIDYDFFIKEEVLTKNLIDDFLQNHIIFRGFCLYCTKCQNSNWYSLADINESFTCERCKSSQMILSVNWKKPYEPMIYYKLNEVFFQGLNNNMKYPLLTLNYLKNISETCFIYSPELELYKDNNKIIELDIVCVSDGEYIIGEVKQNDELPEKLELYNEIVNNLNAKFVLSTFANEWSLNNKNKVKSLSWNKPPLFLTRNDLNNYS